MTQASQGTVIWSIVIATIVMLLASLFVLPTMIGSKIGDADMPTADEIATSLLEGIDIPTAAEIAAEIDTTKIDKIYDKLDANRFDENDIEQDIIDAAKAYATQEMSYGDFEELLADLIDIDEDYLIFTITDMETEITAINRDAAEDGNVKVEGFLRIEYFDMDDLDEDEVIYVVVTADVIDALDEENDQDVEYSIREVGRNFEFD